MFNPAFNKGSALSRRQYGVQEGKVHGRIVMHTPRFEHLLQSNPSVEPVRSLDKALVTATSSRMREESQAAARQPQQSIGPLAMPETSTSSANHGARTQQAFAQVQWMHNYSP